MLSLLHVANYEKENKTFRLKYGIYWFMYVHKFPQQTDRHSDKRFNSNKLFVITSTSICKHISLVHRSVLSMASLGKEFQNKTTAQLSIE